MKKNDGNEKWKKKRKKNHLYLLTNIYSNISEFDMHSSRTNIFALYECIYGVSLRFEYYFVIDFKLCRRKLLNDYFLVTKIRKKEVMDVFFLKKGFEIWCCLGCHKIFFIYLFAYVTP